MLVSVILITYNSSKYVLETLESIYWQTYRDIELIISDDCSTDNTYNICQQWADRHKDRFARIILTGTPHNGGICWNYNHAIRLSKGKWCKYIAGDDTLKVHCIEEFVANINLNNFIYFSGLEQRYEKEQIINKAIPSLPNVSAHRQCHILLKKRCCCHGATLFVESSHLKMLGGFNMQYPMCEDGPITYQFLSLKLSIGIIPKVLVTWRIYQDSVSHSNTSFVNDYKSSDRYFYRKNCWKHGLILYQYHHFLDEWLTNHRNMGGGYKLLGYVLRCVDIVNIINKVSPLKPLKVISSEPIQPQ